MDNTFGFVALGAAVIKQALRDSKSRDDIRRLKALTWLISEDCEYFLDELEADFNPDNFRRWVLRGCQKRSRKHV